jgi:signal transduction histidine kinase
MDKSIQILFIEDNENDVLLEMNELIDGGYDVLFERVETSKDFNKALKDKKWDCIISDYSMPHFSGLEALTELKKTGIDIPFILVSGVIGEETAVAAMKAGSHDYIMKSKLNRLVPAVERELREAEVRRQRQLVVKALKESEQNLKKQISDYQKLNLEYLALNEELKKSFNHIQNMNADLIISKNKAVESDRLKSAFLATMNHELRTPLNHILGFSDLILSGVKPQVVIDYVKKIRDSGKSLLSIIEDIFELALVEQADIKLRKQTLRLSDLFEENKASFDNILRASGKGEQIKLVFKGDNNLLSNYITSDCSKINQVLTNLFKNAVKFTENGSIEFGFNMLEDKKLRFYIKDTGIGIPFDKQTIIFDWFRQGDDSHSRQYGGVGIGLAISLKIAQVLNGELTVESEPGKGSTFFFTLPVIMTEIGIPVQSDLTPHYIDLNLKGKTILIVEDDPLSRSLIRSYLKKTNAVTIEADEGSEAIRKLHNNLSIDLILMDLKMPGMDGYVATHLIKSEKPELPIIALTAYSLAEDRSKALEAGCDSVITKPVDRSILFNEISKKLKMN